MLKFPVTSIGSFDHTVRFSLDKNSETAAVNTLAAETIPEPDVSELAISE